MSCDVGEETESLENVQSSQIEIYSRAHSPTFPSLHLRQSSFSNPSPALPIQLILQPFRCFTYVTAHSPTLISPLLRHRIFTQLILILQAFRHFTYVTAHSPTLLSLYLHQLILQPFRCFTYVTAHSPTLFSPLLRHRIFTQLILILQAFRHFTYVTTNCPILPSLYLHHSSCSNPSFASSTSQSLHLRHLASRTMDTLCSSRIMCILSALFVEEHSCYNQSINQSINQSPVSPLEEHRTFTKYFDRTLFVANFSTSFHVFPSLVISSKTVRFHVFLGLPLALLP